MKMYKLYWFFGALALVVALVAMTICRAQNNPDNNTGPNDPNRRSEKMLDKDLIAEIRKAAESIGPWVIETRRRLHRIPEPRWQESKTITEIKAIIEEIVAGVVFPDHFRKTITILDFQGGLVVDFWQPGMLPGRRLFRADVDALPIVEETGLPFAPDPSGDHTKYMHACGHDAHTAMLLGFLKLVADRKIEPTHHLRLVWQRAEENPIDTSGGDMLVNGEGVCEDIMSAHGLHVWASTDGTPGVFKSRPGAMLANSDRIHIQVKCTGGHVARPQDGSNAIDVGNSIVNSLSGFDRRFLGPLEPCSLIPAVFKAGEASNVRPARVELWFACRNVLSEDKRTAFAEAIEARVRNVVAGFADAEIEEFTYVRGHPALMNTPESVEEVSALLTGADMKVEGMDLEMGGEDFAHYLRKCPGSFFMLGAHKEGAGDHHTPTFDIDEDVLWMGVFYWSLLATK